MFLLSPVFLAVGIAFYYSLPSEPADWLIFSVLPFVLIITLLGLVKSKARISKIFLRLIILGTTGFLLAKFQTIAVNTQMLASPLKNVTIEGRITKIEQTAKGTQRVILENIHIQPPFNHVVLDKLQITIRSKRAIIRLFDQIRLKVSIFPPASAVFPDGYNFYRGFWFQGISAIGFALNHPQIINPAAPRIGEWFSLYLEQIRLNLNVKIMAAMPEHQASIAKALILGDQKAVSEEIAKDMRDSGLAHLLSVSGLHLSLVCLLAFGLFRRILILYPFYKIPWSSKKMAAISAILIAFFYLFLTNAAIPTQRSFIMMAMLMIGILIERHVFGFTTLAWAAVIILLFQPSSLLTASFQMSFLAVAVIIAINNRAYYLRQQSFSDTYLQKRTYWLILRYMYQLIFVSFWVSLAVTPLTLYHFQQGSIYAVLANMVAIPITTFIIMPAALIAVCLSGFNLQDIALRIMGFGIDIVLNMANWVSNLPGATIKVDGITIISVLFAIMAIFIWLSPLISYRRILSLACIMGMAFFTWASPASKPDILYATNEKMIALNDGQEGYYVIVAEKDAFLLELWKERLGKTRVIPINFLAKHPAFICNRFSCTYQLNGQRVNIIYRHAGNEIECEKIQVLINLTPKRQFNCVDHAVNIISTDTHVPFYWGWKQGDNFYFLSTKDIVGQRPWSVNKQEVEAE